MLKPNYYYESIYNLKLEDLSKLNKKYILIDLDNTLVDFNKAFPSKKAVDYINLLSTKFKVIIVSNNHFSRCFLATTGMNCEFINDVYKPLTFKLKRYLKDNDINTNDCLFIGDQLYTDIKVASKLDITSILIEPTATKDLLITYINRKRDKHLRNKLNKRGLLKKIC